MIRHRLIVILLCGLCAFVLTGCPRFAYIEAYNNTPTALMIIDEPTLERGFTLKSGQITRFRFGGQYFNVKSEHGTLTYPRNIPHSGEDGSYFDGTLRIQINPDRKIYALKTSESAPLSNFPEQPYGYPLKGLEEGNILFASCLDEVRKRQAEHYRLIANRQRPTFALSSIDLISCLDRLQAKEATEPQRRLIE